MTPEEAAEVFTADADQPASRLYAAGAVLAAALAECHRELAEFRRTRATGGPAPDYVTPGEWRNITEEATTAHDETAPPIHTRYSSARLARKREP